MRTDSSAVRKAPAGIFLGPARSLYDTVDGDKFKNVDFSHEESSLMSCLVSRRFLAFSRSLHPSVFQRLQIPKS